MNISKQANLRLNHNGNPSKFSIKLFNISRKFQIFTLFVLIILLISPYGGEIMNKSNMVNKMSDVQIDTLRIGHHFIDVKEKENSRNKEKFKKMQSACHRLFYICLELESYEISQNPCIRGIEKFYKTMYFNKYRKKQNILNIKYNIGDYAVIEKQEYEGNLYSQLEFSVPKAYFEKEISVNLDGNIDNKEAITTILKKILKIKLSLFDKFDIPFSENIVYFPKRVDLKRDWRYENKIDQKMVLDKVCTYNPPDGYFINVPVKGNSVKIKPLHYLKEKKPEHTLYNKTEEALSKFKIDIGMYINRLEQRYNLPVIKNTKYLKWRITPEEIYYDNIYNSRHKVDVNKSITRLYDINDMSSYINNCSMIVKKTPQKMFKRDLAKYLVMLKPFYFSKQKGLTFKEICALASHQYEDRTIRNFLNRYTREKIFEKNGNIYSLTYKGKSYSKFILENIDGGDC